MTDKLPSATLNVALLPLPIKWADKQANFEAVEAAMVNLPAGTDVLVIL